MIEAIRATKPSIHPVHSIRRGEGDKRPHVGLRSCEARQSTEKSLVGKGSQAMAQRVVGVHPRPEPPHGCHAHMGMGTQRWRPPEPPAAWFLPLPMLTRPWKPTVLTAAPAGAWFSSSEDDHAIGKILLLQIKLSERI
ncbi:hypothetical protein BS78_03G367900 [Paspalum vaginatum]|nr:hypothetical protein BS78_03G367900 [Paspalum vaginatum]